jgi:hypothetical protein
MRPELSERLASHADAPRRAHRSVAKFLRDLGWEALTPAATLLVSELVPNALVYAPGPIAVHAWDTGEMLRVEVRDTSRVLARLRTPNGGGRGLRLVDALATCWGSAPTDPNGKITWFELAPASR